MRSLLHITNGSAVITPMRQAGIAGRIVTWDDVLHEGPVPAGLNVAALRDVRAEFIASGGSPYDEVVRAFTERDAALEDLRAVDEIVLWFEHDLYDQLQLIQVLDRLSPDRGIAITAVPDDDYLSTQPPARFAGLFPARRAVTSAQHSAARDAWQAFRSSDPRAIVDVLPRVSVLPHLAAALQRHLQQFPSVENGLSRTEQQTLEVLARGAARAKDVYIEANHQREDAIFMGDFPYLVHIRALVPRLITVVGGNGGAALALDSELRITADGQRVLAGEEDRIALCGIDRWLGGVHLTGRGPMWRWDATRGTVRLVS